MTFKVEFSLAAQADLERLFDFLSSSENLTVHRVTLTCLSVHSKPFKRE